MREKLWGRREEKGRKVQGGEGQPMRGTGGEVADIGWKGQVMGSFFNTGMP